MQRKTNNINWLTSVPSNDINFLTSLKNASEEEICKAISLVEMKGGKNKTKLAALCRELKRRQKVRNMSVHNEREVPK